MTVHDVNDKDDPCACAEYVVDMYKHFKELEVSLEIECNVSVSRFALSILRIVLL